MRKIPKLMKDSKQELNKWREISCQWVGGLKIVKIISSF